MTELELRAIARQTLATYLTDTGREFDQARVNQAAIAIDVLQLPPGYDPYLRATAVSAPAAVDPRAGHPGHPAPSDPSSSGSLKSHLPPGPWGGRS